MKTTTKILAFIMSFILLFSVGGTGIYAAAVSVSAPLKISAESGSDNVKLQWTKVSKATGYRVYQKIDGKWKKIASQSQITYTAEKLTASTTYEFGIKSYRKYNGKTYFSSLKSVTIKTKAMPEAKAPTGTATKNSITLKWEAVPGATGYRVYQYKNKKWTKIKSTTATKYTVKSLKSATSYKFKIKPYAKTDSGTVWGDSTVSVTVKTIDPKQTKITSASAGTTTVTLKWSKVSGATGYRVSVLENGSWKKIKSTSALSYKVTKLSSNSEYTFMVRAYNKTKGKVTWYTESESVRVVTKAKDGDLKAYRIEKYKTIFEKDELLVVMSTEDPDMGNLPIEIATKKGSLSMKATIEGMDIRVVYNTSNGKTYMIIDSINSYIEMSEKDMKDMKIDEILKGFEIANVGKISVSSTKFDGKNAIAESYTDTVTGDKVTYYFVADELVACKKEYTNGVTDIIKFHKISNSVDSSAFDSPPWYYVNLGNIVDM